MKMYLDANVEMEATYAYYFSGTVIPPAVTGTYAYFSLEPSAYLGLRIVGNARLQASTGRKKLLDTISYPGLAIKGLAAVGPTLDLYGEVRNRTNFFIKIRRNQPDAYFACLLDSRCCYATRRDESWCQAKLRKSGGLLATG